MSTPRPGLTPEDLEGLRQAYNALEHPSLAARFSSIVGSPVEQVIRLLPRTWSAKLHEAAHSVTARALGVAITSLGEKPPSGAHDDLHRALVLSTGGLGGFFGLPGLLVELPATTILMLRSIADIAHGQGEDLTSPEARLACLEVFALGGRSSEDDYAEIGYYEVRAALALHFSAVARAVAEHGASVQTLPASVRLIQAVAARFGAVISDKAAAQLVPVLGAAAGAVINALFLAHFQRVAEGHFSVRRLERLYGADAVAEAYRRCGGQSSPTAK